MSRRRTVCLVVALLLIPLGLATRRWHDRLPFVIGEYAPDALWATMVYFFFAAIAPRRPLWQIAVAAAVFSFGIEFAQLYHAAWIDSIRATKIGALILGRTFLTWQLWCYLAGIALAAGVDSAISSAARR